MASTLVWGRGRKPRCEAEEPGYIRRQLRLATENRQLPAWLRLLALEIVAADAGEIEATELATMIGHAQRHLDLLMAAKGRS